MSANANYRNILPNQNAPPINIISQNSTNHGFTGQNQQQRGTPNNNSGYNSSWIIPPTSNSVSFPTGRQNLSNNSNNGPIGHNIGTSAQIGANAFSPVFPTFKSLKKGGNITTLFENTELLKIS